MRKMILMVVTMSLLLATVVPGASAAEAAFGDISGHWAEDVIVKWADSGLLSGYPDGTFRPDEPVTRAELSKILTLAFDLNETASLSDYHDLDSNAWYYPYVAHAAAYLPVYALPVAYDTNQPYVDNDSAQEKGFLPDTAALRMHAAEALAEIKLASENVDIEIPDIGEIKTDLNQTFANDAEYENLFVMHGEVPDNVERMFRYTWLAKELDVMEGKPDGTFDPYGVMTRAEALTAIDRLLAA